MNTFQLSILLALLATAGLGGSVFLSAPRRSANQGFAIMSAIACAWLFCLMKGATASDADTLAFWIRASCVAGTFIPFSFYVLRVFIISPPDTIRAWFRDRATHGWLLSLGTMAAYCASPWFMVSASLPVAPVTVAVPHYGPLYFLYPTYFLATTGYVIRMFIRDLLSVNGIKRFELQFVSVGVALSLIVTLAFLIVSRIAEVSLETGRFLPFVVAVVLYGTIAYGIATRRILGVSYVLRRIVAYASMAIYLSGVYGILWFVVERTLEMLEIRPEFPAPHLVATLMVAISVVPARGWAQRFAERVFLRAPVANIEEAIDRAGRILRMVTRLDVLLAQFASVLEKNLGVERVRILMAADADQRFVQNFPAEGSENGGGLVLDRAAPVVRALESRSDLLARDVLDRTPGGEVERDCVAWMARGGEAMVVGVQAKLGLQGIIVIGQRENGRVYDALEQRAIQLLANQLGVALENARLYTELQDSKMYTDLVVESLASGLIVTDMDWRVTVINPKARELTGLAPADGAELHARDLPAPLRRILAETMTRRGSFPDQDVTIERPDGHAVPLRVSSAVVRGHRGEARGALLLAGDMTEVKRMEEQVRRTDRLSSLGTLSAGMAHEIKNPLVALKTFTQLLPERYGDPEFRDTFFNLVGHEITRIDSIVNRLLGFARPVAPSMVRVSLHRVLGDSLQLVKQQAAGVGVSVERRFDAASDVILGDEDLLKQAFLNFLLNAVEAMPDGGVLGVTTAQTSAEAPDAPGNGPRERIVVSIADTGKGIRPDDMQHVFDPFFTTKSTGTGLGLSVAHGILQEHQAGIDVSSEIGRGTTFSLSFPLAGEQEERSA